MQAIDTHAHFHDPGWPGGLIWPKPDAPCYRPCLPKTYRAEVGPNPVVAVETSPRPADDARLAGLARDDPQIVAYVSNLQPLSRGFDRRLEAAARDPKWRGVRLRPIEGYDLGSRDLIRALAPLEGLGHIELGIRHPRRLDALRQFCRALPGINVVLTHAGHPVLSGTETISDYSRLDGLENLFVKLSPPQDNDFSDTVTRDRMRRHFVTLRDVLAPHRFVFGSNWPVCADPGPFRQWLRGLFSVSAAEAEAVMAGTARTLYRLSL
ncbi:MAG: amidohydrolase family protein [Pseudomonadota bacterium]